MGHFSGHMASLEVVHVGSPAKRVAVLQRMRPPGSQTIAERGEEVRPEPFDALPLRVGALFGDDDAEPAEDG